MYHSYHTTRLYCNKSLTSVRATQVVVDRPATAENVKVTGAGLNPKYCRAGMPVTFKVDATKAAKGNLDVKMTTDKGKEKKSDRPLFVC